MYNAIIFLAFLFVFLIGITIGSFLNVLIYRIPQKLGFVTGRSFCPKCKNEIKPYDLIPLFSFFILGGKCRNCKCRISPRYPAIEGLCGVLFVLCFYTFGFTLQTVAACILSAILITVTFIDFDTMTIPNGLVIAIIVPCILSFISTGYPMPIDRVIGFFCVSVPLFVFTLIAPGSFGGGDIKLMAMCGLFLGWVNVVLATVIGFIVGGVAVLIMLLLKKVKKGVHIPFGPWLALGVFISMLWGNDILLWYISLL